NRRGEERQPMIATRGNQLHEMNPRRRPRHRADCRSSRHRPMTGRQPIAGGDAMLFALLLSALADVPSPIVGAVQTHDMATLTWQQAQQLQGQSVRVSLVVDSMLVSLASGVRVDAENDHGLSVTIRFARGMHPAKGLQIGKRYTVEGQLVARYFPGRT